MKASDRDPHIGPSAVPRWFMDVLHAVIYADGQDGYFAILALSWAMDAHSPTELAILAELARGSSQTQIAAALGMSRHCVCRRVNALRRRFGDANLRRIRGNRTAGEALAAFASCRSGGMRCVRAVTGRLARLSPVELGVLFALVRHLPEGETLAAVGISHTWYHTVAARLSAEFHLVAPSRKKVSFSVCIHNHDLLPYAPLTEKCTFLFIFLFSYRRDARFSVSLSLFYAVRLISKTTIGRCATFQETWNRACRTVAPPPVRTSRRVAQDWRPPGTGAANQLSDAQTPPLAPSPHQSPAAASF